MSVTSNQKKEKEKRAETKKREERLGGSETDGSEDHAVIPSGSEDAETKTVLTVRLLLHLLHLLLRAALELTSKLVYQGNSLANPES